MAPSPRRPLRTATVSEVHRIAEQVVRVVLGGPGLADVTLGDAADHYVKLMLCPAGVSHPEPWDLERIRTERPAAEWPVPRAYTVREHDAARGEISLDVVTHGEAGLGGPWATRVRAGDTVHLQGPGGDWAPDPAAPWHLLVGDGSALPAIGEAVRRLGPGATVVAVLDVADAELVELVTAAELRVVRLDPTVPGAPADRAAAVLEALTGIDRPAGVPEAFIHGEAGTVRAVRRWVRTELGVGRDRLSASGYWRRGRTDEAWRAEKRDWAAEVERDDAVLAARA